MEVDGGAPLQDETARGDAARGGDGEAATGGLPTRGVGSNVTVPHGGGDGGGGGADGVGRAVPAVDELEGFALSPQAEPRAPGATAGPTVYDASVGRSVVSDFLKSHTCYDAIPESGKVVVFDTAIPLKLAFYALVEHSLNVAPIWSREIGAVDGVLTCSDLIDVMRYDYSRGEPGASFAEHTIASWRELSADPEIAWRPEEPVMVHPDRSLLDVVVLLRDYRIHRLPVIDPENGTILSVLSHWDMMRYLVTQFREERPLFVDSIRELGVGRTEHVSVPQDMPLIDVFAHMMHHRLSVVAIVDADGVALDVWSRRDVKFLAHDPTLEYLSMPVGEVRAAQVSGGYTKEVMHTCSPDNRLQSVIEAFGGAQVHWLVCVDDDGRCIAVVTVQDIFEYFVGPIGSAPPLPVKDAVQSPTGGEGSSRAAAGGAGAAAGAVTTDDVALEDA